MDHARGMTAWRIAALLAGLGVIALGAWGMRNPLASMTTYASALMALNQAAPPLLLLALPRRIEPAGPIRDFLLDPWVAIPFFGCLCVAVSLPGILNPSLTNALYTLPLGLLMLFSGLLFWSQLMPATRRLKPRWRAGALAWIGMMPMTVVAVVWMLAQHVLYAPYLDILCLWNVPPILDQRWAGFVMLVSGFPAQVMGLWLLLWPEHVLAAPVPGGKAS